MQAIAMSFKFFYSVLIKTIALRKFSGAENTKRERYPSWAFLVALLSLFIIDETLFAAAVPVSLDGAWQIATDTDNSGRAKNWSQQTASDALECRVPSTLQQTFPDYNGLVWYWREFEVPASFQSGERFLLRFEQVDYYAEIWLNGKSVGQHEGGETPFVFDVTDALTLNGKNFLAVRVLNPTHEEIDGIVLTQTPRRCKVLPYVTAGGTYNHGGITGSVTLEAVPGVYVDDVFVDARIEGKVTVQVTVCNASEEKKNAVLEINLGEGRNGSTMISRQEPFTAEAGNSVRKMEFHVENPRLWELNSPALYRAAVRVSTEQNESMHEKSVRFGFRDFRFENGYFRLNGKRIFVKSTHSVNNYPIGLQFPHDPDLWRRDLLNLKAMGFNMVRFIWGGAFPEQLDYCDEIGLMVYNESYASNDIQDSPNVSRRWHEAIFEVIRRDRNHPSVVLWGLLNEIKATSAIFPFAVESLPRLREWDPSRAVMLNSGRWDVWSWGGLDPKLLLWNGETQEPFVGKNPTDEQIEVLGISWPPHRVALHPGKNNEYALLRWSVPESGSLDIKAVFEGFAQKATTDVHVVLRGNSLFDSFVNLNDNGNAVSFEKAGIPVEKGDSLDFIVGSGNQNYGGDTTGLSATLVLNRKATELSDAFTDDTNADEQESRWSCGVLPGTEQPETQRWTQMHRDRTPSLRQMTGTISNPDSLVWEDLVQDTHPYQRVPHTADIIQFLRTTRGYAPESDQPLFMSEYGIGSAVDLIRTMLFFEEYHAENLCDAKYYQLQLDKFYADWEKWHLEEAFDRPEDFFAQSIAKMASQRSIGLNAIRSNPAIVGHNVTGAIDHVMTGEGLTTPFRELKPGTVDAMFDAWSPLRWSVFAEPIHLYRGANLHIESVLSNEDKLVPGAYPARAEIFDSHGRKVYEKPFEVTIDPAGEKEPPFAKLCFQDELPFDFPTGTYRFVTTLEKGGAAAGGEVRFFVTDKRDMPKVDASVLIWNDDPLLSDWCAKNGIKASDAALENIKPDSVILVTSGAERAGLGPNELDAAIRAGASAIFLQPEYFQNEQARKIFLENKGAFINIFSWLYQKDEWSKKHPFFNGLPSGGLMDNQYYREIIPAVCFRDTAPALDAVAGSIKASQDYESGLMLAVYPHEKGRMILSTFLIRENLENHPAGEFLLKNIINNAR